jgi:hypothetical protein
MLARFPRMLPCLLFFLSGCHSEQGPITLDKIEAYRDFRVLLYFSSIEKGFDEERNYFSCVSGDGNPDRFYQDRQSGIWTFGAIESLGFEANKYRYVTNMEIYFYDRNSNSFGNDDKRKILSELNHQSLKCRVVARNYYYAPDLSNVIEINGDLLSVFLTQ